MSTSGKRKVRLGLLVGGVLALALSALGSGLLVRRVTVEPNRARQSLPPKISPSNVPTYRTNVFETDRFKEGGRASARQEDFFAGYVNGIRVGWNQLPRCEQWVRMTPSQINDHRIPTPRELPRGAREIKTGGQLCNDKPIVVDRVFQMGRSDVYLTIGRHYDWNYLMVLADEDRVKPAKIQGLPAVFVRPVAPSGWGNSYIAFKDGDDLVVFEGLDIRFGDLVEAAQSFPFKGA